MEKLPQYGDKHLLAEHYHAIEKYIDTSANILVQEDPSSWGNLGDWLGPEQEKKDNSMLWEAYYIFDLEIMKNVAAILDMRDDGKHFDGLYQQCKKFFNETYVDKKSIYSGFQQYKKSLIKARSWIHRPLCAASGF